MGENEDQPHGSPLAMVCRCGLPMTPNPHPQAGTVSMQNDFGYAYECIPCLVQTRNRVGRSWRRAEAQVEWLRKSLAMASAFLVGTEHYSEWSKWHNGNRPEAN